MSSTKGTGTPHVAAETGRIRPAVERHSGRKIVVRLWSENSALGSSQRLSVVPGAVICSRICRTVRPLRSAAIITLESRITPTLADPAVCGS